MAELSRRGRIAFAAGTALATLVLVPIAVHKGEDITAHLALTDLWIRGAPLYRAFPTQGTWWPPFTTLLVAPFAGLARLSPALAKGLWTALGVWCVAAAVDVAGRRWGWRPAFLALAATAWPVWDNFQHGNIEAYLLLAIVLGAAALAGGRDRRAGVWLGIAAAVKAFPALLLVYLAVRGRWRAAAWGLGAAVAGTALALLRYGPAGAVDAGRHWVTLAETAQSQAGLAVSAFHMQKLGRWLYALGAGWAGVLAGQAALVALLGAIVALGRRRASDLVGIGATTLVAVLLAPIAWLHDFTLAIPAWVGALARDGAGDAGAAGGTAASPRTRSVALVVAGVLTSGMLGHVRFPRPVAFVPLYNDVVGSLVLLAVLVADGLSRRAAPQ